MLFESQDGAICYAHAPKCCSRTVLGWMLLSEHPHLIETHPGWFAPQRTRSQNEYSKIRERSYIHRVPGNHHHFQGGVVPKMKAPIRIAVARNPVDRFISGFKNRVLFHRAVKDIETIDEFIERFDDLYKNNKEINIHFRPLWQFIGRDPSIFTHVFIPDGMNHLRGLLSGRYGVTLPDIKLQSTTTNVEVKPEHEKWINERFSVDAEDYHIWQKAAEETLSGKDAAMWSGQYEPVKRIANPTDSLVLVGNGPSVLDYSLGPVIDSFDKVIRFNAFQTNGLERHVGAKTSYWSTHGGCTALPRDESLPKRGILVYETSESGIPLDEIWRIPWAFYRDVRARLRAESKQENRDIIGPTSGLVVALWLIESEKVWNVHLAGFDHFRKDRSCRHHYWINQRFSRPPELDGDAESRLLHKYVTSGRIRYLT
jgi:hypothetical protein